MNSPLIRSFAIAAALALPAFAQPAPAPAANPLALTIDAFAKTPPFSFTYNGKSSADFLPTWQRTEDTKPADGGEVHTISWTDPATQLKVTAEVRTFTDFTALDWVVTFTDGGSADTPILEKVESLDWTRPCPGNSPQMESWYGGNGGGEDFTPSPRGIDMNSTTPTETKSVFGRSSRNTLPYLYYFDGNYNGSGVDLGPGGLAFGIGWTGNWDATMLGVAAAKTMRFTIGPTPIHLLLHAGETIRAPRIVALNWTGDGSDAANQWRKLMLRHYAPQPAAGQDLKLPILFGGGGGKSDERVAQIGKMADAKFKFDLYGLANWAKARGSWTPDPAAFPNGLKPVVDAAKAAGMGIMLNLEPEVGDPGSDLLTQHPDWFFPAKGDQPAILNFGNPDARKAITDLVSQLITETGATWFHHHISDYRLDDKWNTADTPDRVGITENKYITGLYQFWDDLRQQHPGLLIDQPGWRVDIETLRRGSEIWGNTYGHPECNQTQLSQLTKWFPLTAGLCYIIPPDLPQTDATRLYTWRTSYGPGWTISTPLPADGALQQAMDEYRRAQPYFLGNVNLLNNYDFDPTSGLALQADRPDLKAGVVIVLRRQECPFSAVQPMLHGIDPAATYDVEIKSTLAPGTTQQMSGADLIKIQIPVPDKPGSALVFYKQK